jgi:hypothetical protein
VHWIDISDYDILEDAVSYFGGFVEVTSTGQAPTVVRVWLPLQPTAEASE